jgi:RNase P protein component
MFHVRLRPGHDVILIARPALTALNLVEIQQVVKQLCQRANLWMEEE